MFVDFLMYFNTCTGKLPASVPRVYKEAHSPNKVSFRSCTSESVPLNLPQLPPAPARWSLQGLVSPCRGWPGSVAPQRGANPFPFSTFGVSTVPRGSRPLPTARRQGCGGAGPPPGHRAPPGWPLHRGGSRCPHSAPSRFSSSSSRSFSCSASPPCSPSRPSCRSTSPPGSLRREAKP